jgi:DSF synthase
MDRHLGDLDGRGAGDGLHDGQAIPLSSEPELFVGASKRRLAVPARLFQLEELDVLYEQASSALWTFMRPRDRPSFSLAMLREFDTWQTLIAQSFGPERVPLRYLILGSRTPGVFCFGGDLELFARLIRSQDRDGLVAYGRRCVEILDRNIRTLDLPMVTIGLVQGQALGGGFEALLSFDYIVAEKGSSFGLPEITFGLFPGMGAHPLLSRKVGTALADRMILANETWSAEALHELGIVHVIAEPGEGVEAVRDFMKRSDRRHAGIVGARRAMRESSPIEMIEFYHIVEIWADTAIQLREQDLRMMERLAAAQVRLAKAC